MWLFIAFIAIVAAVICERPTKQDKRLEASRVNCTLLRNQFYEVNDNSSSFTEWVIRKAETESDFCRWCFGDDFLGDFEIPTIIKARFMEILKFHEGLIKVKEKTAEIERMVIPRDVKISVWNRDGGRCVECWSNESLEFDHIIPVSRGWG